MVKDQLGSIVRMLSTVPVEKHEMIIDLLNKLDDPIWEERFKNYLKAEFDWEFENVLWRRINETSIIVNLDAKVYASGGMRIVRCVPWNVSGWVRVERVGDFLLVNDRIVQLHAVCKPHSGLVRGVNFLRDVQRQQVLHPNIGHALLAADKLIPETWRRTADNRVCFVNFFAAGYRTKQDPLQFVSLYYVNDRWENRFHGEDAIWDSDSCYLVLGPNRRGLLL